MTRPLNDRKDTTMKTTHKLNLLAAALAAGLALPFSANAVDITPADRKRTWS
jgi:predicted secreted protein